MLQVVKDRNMIEKQANCAASSPFIPPPSSFSLTVVPSHLQLKLWLLAGGLDGGMQKHSWECGQDLQRVCVRARACACDPLVFASLSGGGNFNSACVLAAQWNI